MSEEVMNTCRPKNMTSGGTRLQQEGSRKCFPFLPSSTFL